MKSIFFNPNLRPINKTAALVTSNGFSLESSHQYRDTFKEIPEVIDYNHPRCGETFGRLTIVGLHSRRPEKKHLFVCRCHCGNYSIRNGRNINRTIKNPELASVTMCGECSYLLFLRRNKEKRATIIIKKRSKLCDGEI